MDPKDQILARMYVVLTLLSLVPFAVAVQMVRIHVTQGEELREQGERQASSFVTIPAKRGAILDRAGRTLAVNTARYDLAVDPTARGFDDASSLFFERLSKLTGRPASTFRRKVSGRSSPQYVLLLRAISEAQKEAIESWQVPGLLLDPSFARRYNYGRAAAHILGHVNADGRGIAGLELQYDEYLQGTDGERAAKRDRLGQLKAFVQGKVVEPKHGESLLLTIDLIRQTVMEEELERGVVETGATWGSAVALDPYTGAILAMANVPTYDPNRAGAYSTDARRNRAITDRLEPGSTFKLVAAAAAVEQGIVTLDDSVETGAGWAVIHGRTMHDTHAHGTVTFADVIALSSNVGTARVVSEMEPGVLYQYARNLGFGNPTWVDLPGEVQGLLKRPESWSGTSLTSIAIGYEVDVTPLQLVTAYAALANGGLLVRPHVVAERRDVFGNVIWRARQDSIRRAFKPETARKLLPAFERAVAEGTAKLAAVEGLPVAGKTGTARKVSGGSYEPGAYRASFIGFFPADAPRVVMAIVLDEPRSSWYGGSAAAPIFQRTADRWIATFPEIAQRVSPPDSLPSSTEMDIPDVRGLPAAIAQRQLESRGYHVRARSDREFIHPVALQSPAGGSAGHAGSMVRITTADTAGTGAATMPDVRGLSSRDALFWLSELGVEVKLDGVGTVVAQTPAPGEAFGGRIIIQSR